MIHYLDRIFIKAGLDGEELAALDHRGWLYVGIAVSLTAACILLPLAVWEIVTVAPR